MGEVLGLSQNETYLTGALLAVIIGAVGWWMRHVEKQFTKLFKYRDAMDKRINAIDKEAIGDDTLYKAIDRSK